MARDEKEMTQAKDQKNLAKDQKEKEAKSAPRNDPNAVQSFFQRMNTGIRRYFAETIGELRKVTWPTRREALGLTSVVLVVMIFMAIVLGGLDALFAFGLAKVLTFFG